MPILNKACIIVDLRTGSEYIGWVGSVLTVLRVIIDVLRFKNPEYNVSDLTFNIIICLAFLLISVCLIRAAKTNNNNLLIVWLVGTGINLILINLFYLIIVFHTLNLLAYILLGLLIADTIGAYLWLCVYSFYKLLIETPKSERETVLMKDAGKFRIQCIPQHIST